MTSITLTWTALPNGIYRSDADDAWRARLSVFLTPRLEVDAAATLDAFPVFADWPKRCGTPDPPGCLSPSR